MKQEYFCTICKVDSFVDIGEHEDTRSVILKIHHSHYNKSPNCLNPTICLIIDKIKNIAILDIIEHEARMRTLLYQTTSSIN